MTRAYQLGLEIVECRKLDVVGAIVETHHTSAHTVFEAMRLVEDLLDHEVRETALGESRDVEIDLLDIELGERLVEIDNLYLMAETHVCHLLIVEIDHLVGVFDHRSGIAADEELVVAFADANHKR